LVGKEGSGSFWLLMQHHDLHSDFSGFCFGIDGERDQNMEMLQKPILLTLRIS
jgi:hypothetical protein